MKTFNLKLHKKKKKKEVDVPVLIWSTLLSLLWGDRVGEGAGKCIVGSIMLEFFLEYMCIYIIYAKNVFRKETRQGGIFPFLLSLFL